MFQIKDFSNDKCETKERIVQGDPYIREKQHTKKTPKISSIKTCTL